MEGKGKVGGEVSGEDRERMQKDEGKGREVGCGMEE